MSLGSLLSQLENDQLIYRDDAPDLSYLFKHALTQETAYESLLKAKRAELHRRVAETIEQLVPDQLEQNAAVLAFHYDRAKMDDKAFTYAALAGDMARRAYAHDEALAFYDHALEIGQRLTDSQWIPRLRAVYTNRGNVFEVQSNHSAANENYQAMIAFAQRIGNLVIEADAMNHLATVQVLMTGSAPETVQHLERALALARRAGNEEVICRALWNFGLAYRFEDPPRAAGYLEQALAMARAANLDELVAFALVDLMGAMRLTGRWRLAVQYGQEALGKFQKMDNKPMIADVLGGLGAIWFIGGDTSKSRAAALEGVQTCQAIGNPWGLHVSMANLAEIAFAHGEILQVLSDGESLLAGGREIGFPLFIGLPLMLLARAHLELNQLDRAQTLAEQAASALDVMKNVWVSYEKGLLGRMFVRRGELERARQVLEPLWRTDKEAVAHFYGYLTVGPAIAELALAEHRLDEGLQFGDWILTRCEQEEIWGFAAEMYFLRSQIHFERGDLTRAENDSTHARDILERAENKILLWRVDAALARIYARLGDSEHAQEAKARARQIVGEITQKISDVNLRKGFLSREDVRDVVS